MGIYAAFLDPNSGSTQGANDDGGPVYTLRHARSSFISFFLPFLSSFFPTSAMQSNQWGQYPYSQQQQPSFLNSQPTGFAGAGLQPMQTGFPQQQRPQQTGIAGAQPGQNYAFLNQPPSSNFRGNGIAPQMTGFPGGTGMVSQQTGMMPQQTGFNASANAGRMMPQQTGFQGGMMSQPTGMMSQSTGMGLTPQQTGWQGGAGLMSQPTGIGRLQAQPTGMPHDPRLQTMMQSFMPSNMSQVSELLTRRIRID